MPELNMSSVAYVSFRLAPVILISYFILSSMFRQDLKGLIYLMGLIMACFFSASIGNIFPDKFTKSDTDDRLCNVFTLTQSGPISRIPLSQTVFGYTFCYLLYIIMSHNLAIHNAPTLIIFPILIISDFIWTANHKCSSTFATFISLLIGCLSGLIWSYVIDSTNNANLHYFNGLTNEPACSVPKRKTFKCKKGTK